VESARFASWTVTLIISAVSIACCLRLGEVVAQTTEEWVIFMAVYVSGFALAIGWTLQICSTPHFHIMEKLLKVTEDMGEQNERLIKIAFGKDKP